MNRRVKKTELQSVVFIKDFWTLRAARAWLRRHRLKTDLDEKSGTWRFRQTNPKKYKRFRSIQPGGGITLIIGIL